MAKSDALKYATEANPTDMSEAAMRAMDMPEGMSTEHIQEHATGEREIIEDDGGWVYALSKDGSIEILVEGAGGKGNATGAVINKGIAYDAIMLKFKGIKPKGTHKMPDGKTMDDADMPKKKSEPDTRTSDPSFVGPDEADGGPDLRQSDSGPNLGYSRDEDLRQSFPGPDLRQSPPGGDTRTSPSGPDLRTSPSGPDLRTSDGGPNFGQSDGGPNFGTSDPGPDLRTSDPGPDLRTSDPGPDIRTSRDEDLRTSDGGGRAPGPDVDVAKLSPISDYAKELMKTAMALSKRLQASGRSDEDDDEYSLTPVADHARTLAEAVGKLSEWLSATDLAPGLFGDVSHDGGPAATRAAELNAEANPRDSSMDAERDAASEELDYMEGMRFGTSKSPKMDGDTMVMPPMAVKGKRR